jgi:riboflavin synthase
VTAGAVGAVTQTGTARRAAEVFTGLVRQLAGIDSVRRTDAGVRLAVTVGPELGPVAHGDSIAVDGVCLTVAALDGRRVEFDVIAETLRKTTLGDRKPGDRVNLEPSLRVGDVLGGHFVQGHVDGVGSISEIDNARGEWITRIACPRALSDQMVPKGSIAVDGTSLTLVDVGPEGFSIALIPTTLEKTTLGFKRVGDRVNLETDVLGKYILKRIADFRLKNAD